MDEEENVPDTSKIPEDECCICGSYEVAIVDPFGYPFCAQHDRRAHLLTLGRELGWPALRTAPAGVLGYALDASMQSWIMTALIGDEERVAAILEAAIALPEDVRQSA